MLDLSPGSEAGHEAPRHEASRGAECEHSAEIDRLIAAPDQPET
jgi:hypothetical protein